MKWILWFFCLLCCACSNQSRQNVPMGQRSLAQGSKSTAIKKIESFPLMRFSVRPGEVRRVVYPRGDVTAEDQIVCGDYSIKAHHEDGKLIFFLSESYFSKMSPYTCRNIDKGKRFHFIKVSVNEKKFRSERLHVNKKRVVLSPENLKRVRREQAMLTKIYQGAEAVPFFEFRFIQPLKTKVTSIYGTRRVFNNQRKTQHLGTDYRASVGTSIKSSNGGKVVLVDDLFFTGKTIIIDHGIGIFTVYGHLSDLKVKSGDLVQRGDIIGLSGRSGRVTGPHLHWGVKVNGNWVEGNSLIAETMVLGHDRS